MTVMALREPDHSRSLLRAMQRIQLLHALQHDLDESVRRIVSRTTDRSGQGVAVLGSDVGSSLDRVCRQPQMVPQDRIGFRSQRRSDGDGALERGRARLAVIETSGDHNQIMAIRIEPLCCRTAPEQSSKPSSATTSVIH